MPRLADVLAVLDEAYDPSWAEPWDAVGLVCGDPEAEVRRVLLAVDPVADVAEEAVDAGADLIVCHHPLFLRGTHSIAMTTAKGRLVTRLVRAGIALHVAHTNADIAQPGVSDALATTLGLVDLAPLRPAAPDPLDKLVTFVPHDDVDRVVDALAAAGAGALGDYTRCAWTATGTGTFRPGVSAQPAIGVPGRVERVPETRVEMILARPRRPEVVRALQTAHPYEEPAYDVVELALPPGRRGLGRVGRLPQPERLADFVHRAAAALPATAGGLRATGDPDRVLHRVAVSGGAGDSLLDAAVSVGADAFLTADLRHHPASEHAADTSVALIDAAHWATEWPWLLDVAQLLHNTFDLQTAVSTRVTDPWTLHVPSDPQGACRP